MHLCEKYLLSLQQIITMMMNKQQLRELLIDNGFKEIDKDLFTKGEWMLSIYKSEFEVYNNPSEGGQYYKGTLEELEYILNNI